MPFAPYMLAGLDPYLHMLPTSFACKKEVCARGRPLTEKHYRHIVPLSPAHLCESMAAFPEPFPQKGVWAANR
ncbi:hypothetical protein ApDm4_0665 [Acetobacter pomorum]|nr:hypothetical protein ApDm4_0665 [Acetobacter pomorum]